MTKIAKATKSLKYGMVNGDGVLHKVNKTCDKLPERPWTQVEYMSLSTVFWELNAGHKNQLHGISGICSCLLT